MPTLLPFVPQPETDELLSSWLARIAAVYQQTWPMVAASVQPELAAIPDWNVGDEALDRLAEVTNINPVALARLDLAKNFSAPSAHWFVFKPRTFRADSAYCGSCLVKDIQVGRDSFLRHQWAIAGISHCSVHHELLRTRCHHCSKEASYRWVRSAGLSKIYCAHCGGGLHYRAGTPEPLWDDIGLRFAVFAAEELIYSALQNNDGEQPGSDRELQHGFLKMLERIAKFVDREVPGSGAGTPPRYTLNPIAAVIVGIHRRRNGLSAPDGYPLADRSATSRGWLLAACLHVLISSPIMSTVNVTTIGFKRALMLLIDTMDKEGERVFWRRARKWAYVDDKPFSRIWSAERASLTVQRQSVFVCEDVDLVASLRDVFKRRQKKTQRNPAKAVKRRAVSPTGGSAPAGSTAEGANPAASTASQRPAETSQDAWRALGLTLQAYSSKGRRRR